MIFAAEAALSTPTFARASQLLPETHSYLHSTTRSLRVGDWLGSGHTTPKQAPWLMKYTRLGECEKRAEQEGRYSPAPSLFLPGRAEGCPPCRRREVTFITSDREFRAKKPVKQTS